MRQASAHFMQIYLEYYALANVLMPQPLNLKRNKREN